MFSLRAVNLAKRFGPRRVFTDISFDVAPGRPLAVIGPNGSGKTTVLLTLLRMYHPSGGEVAYLDGETALDAARIRTRSVLVAPYVNLYDGLTAEENLVFFLSASGGHATGKQINTVMARVGLEGRGGDMVRSYSSGMKQRLKYALAILRQPTFLFLDEPTANLDDDGRRVVFELVEEYRTDHVVVLATNETEEKELARQVCQLGG